MYDTVNLWLAKEDISSKDFFTELSDINEWHNEKQGYSYRGKLKNYIVSVYENGISLKGSLAKYYLDNNIETLTMEMIQKTIEKLSNELHIDLRQAKVSRLDIGAVIPTKHPPYEYFHYLGNKPRFKRLEVVQGETIYYNNHQRQLAFYDKAKEAAVKGTNLLRYELRYKCRFKKQLKTDVIASMLYDETFYQSIVQNWFNEFQTIQKLKNHSIILDNVTSPKELKEATFANLLQKEGQSYVDRIIADVKATKCFKNRSDYTKAKNDFNNLLSGKRGEQSDIMQELEAAIYYIAKNAQ